LKRLLLGLAGWAGGGVLAWLALRGVDWGTAKDGVVQVNWNIAIVAVAAVAFAHYLKACRSKLLLRGEKVSPGRLFLVRATGTGVNTISPLRGVGEAAEVALLSKGDGVPASKVVASLLLASLFDLVVTAGLLCLGLLALPQLAEYRPLVVALASGSLALLLAAPMLVRKLAALPGARRYRAIGETLAAIQTAQADWRIALAGLALTGAGWMFFGVAAWLIAQAMGVGLPLWMMIVLMVATMRFSGLIPAPPGIVGVYEFVTISALGFLGIDEPRAMAFALVSHALIYLPPLLITAGMLFAERAALLSAARSLASPLRRLRLRQPAPAQALD
jgi:uncharacterized membrane protein YbhN (UPF0104 family)